MGKNSIRVAVILLALAGVAISSYLLWAHIHYNYASGHGASLCSISAKLSCGPAAISSWSTIFGVPIASLGIGFYICSIVLTLWAWRTEHPGTSLALLSVFSLLSVIYSVVLLIVSFTVVQIPCPFCVALYVVNLFLLLLMVPLARTFGITKLVSLIWNRLCATILSRQSAICLAILCVTALLARLYVEAWKN